MARAGWGRKPRLLFLTHRNKDMKPKIYKCYKGIVKYHRIDDLQEGSPKNGSIVHLDAMWIADSDERFAGDVILKPAESLYWLPERDVDITEEISRAEYDLACSQISRVHGP